MLVLSSPSGAGKTTLARRLIASDAALEMSISATTRPRRPGETEGVDYRFVDTESFDLMVNRRELLEYAKVFDHYYGTPRAPVERVLKDGRDVLFDVDWQGTQQLREQAGGDVVSVFVLPPSLRELEQRLHRRAQDSDAVIAGRMAKATEEMSHWSEYDYVVVNSDIEQSLASVTAILTAERLRRDRQLGLGDFVKRLRAGS